MRLRPSCAARARTPSRSRSCSRPISTRQSSKYQVIQAARLYRNEIAISAVDTPVPRAIASQASDELLNISGILASFVLYPGAEGEVMISARSIGSCNVQMVLEPLGGGGNAATAGAQIRGSTVRDVLRELVASIDQYYEG